MADLDRAKLIFERALAAAGREREALVREGCGDDAELADLVLGMLAEHEGGAGSGRSITPRGSKVLGTGDLVGPYRLMSVIGEGAFGTVWLAEQREPIRRRVALKVLKLGMDSKEVLARFEAERQALALMDHPNVAKVFDAGTTERGQPYFAMEHVPGVAVTEFCDDQKLAIKERVELFITICNAVQHAHSKGIIHRDLKPSNILVMLVDGKPVAKVIDFGIAKATSQQLTARTLFTETGRLMGTPEYMSPEQAGTSGLDVDTRSDVYSLGVLLYVVLSGSLPFDRGALRSAGLDGVIWIIKEFEPPRPSTRLSRTGRTRGGTPGGTRLGQVGLEPATPHDEDPAHRTPEDIAARRRTDLTTLVRQLRGDLDWIVGKAMEKERGRRYETAQALGLDLGRYLAGDLVLARPPNVAYRLTKMVRRHRVPIGVVAITLLMIALGVLAAGVSVVAAAGVGVVTLLAGLGITWRALRETRRQRDDAEALRQQESLTRAEAQRERDAAERARRAETAARKQAEESRREAEAARAEATSALAEAKARAEELEQVAKFQEGQLSEVDPALMGLRIRDDLIDDIVKGMEQDKASPEAIAKTREDLLNTLSSADLTGVAVKALDRNIFSRTIKAIDEQFKSQPLIHARLLHALAATMVRIGIYEQAVELERKALAIRTKEQGPDHPDTLRSMGDLVEAMYYDDREGALRLARVLIEHARRVLGPDHVVTAYAMSQLGLALLGVGEAAQAEPILRDAHDRNRSLLGPDDLQTLWDLGNLGSAIRFAGRQRESLPLMEEVLASWRSIVGTEHQNFLMCESNVIGILRDLGELDQAAEKSESNLQKRRATNGDEHGGSLTSASVRMSILNQLRQYSQSVSLADHFDSIAHRVWRRIPMDLGIILARIGAARAGVGDFARAESTLLESHELLIRAGQKPGTRWLKECAEALVALYDAWEKAEPGNGYDAKAAEWRKKLEETEAATKPPADKK